MGQLKRKLGLILWGVSLALIGELGFEVDGFSDESAGLVSTPSSSRLFFGKPPRLGLSYFGIYSGPSLDLQGYHPNPQGQSAGSIGSWNILGANIKDVAPFDIDFQFIWDWDMSNQQRQTLLNPRIGISGTVVRNDRLSLWANFNFEVPASQSSQAQGRLTSIGGFQEFHYQWGESRALSTGFFHWARVYLYHRLGDGSGSTFDGALTPLTRYRLSRSLALQLAYVMNYRNARFANVSETVLGVQQLQPGVTWDITSNVNIMPYLILHPWEGVRFSNSSLGFWLSVGLI